MPISAFKLSKSNMIYPEMLNLDFWTFFKYRCRYRRLKNAF
ncbi:hypothetical protein BN128_1450 [Cronobacter sakazakii 696]|nr:hypothetical protein BN128_1450 [Cronobacter sakazakii 696]